MGFAERLFGTTTTDDHLWEHIVAEQAVEALDEKTGELVDIPTRQDDQDDVEGILVAFDYENAIGDRSRRALLCWQCWHDGPTIYVCGYCSARSALRTFRPDRMSRLTEARTRRPIDDPVEYFSRYAMEEDDPFRSKDVADASLRRKEEAASRQALHAVRRLTKSGVRLLAAVAIADGTRVDAETDAIGGYILQRAKDAGIEVNDRTFELLIGWAKAVVPTPGMLSRTATELVDPQHRALVYQWIKVLIESDGRVDASEARVLYDFLDRLKRAHGRTLRKHS